MTVKRFFLWAWVVVSGVIALAGLVAAVSALIGRAWEAAILPGIIALGFGVTSFFSARGKRFEFFFGP